MSAATEPAAAASPDRAVDRAGDAAHRAHAVLGADGLCDHGRADGRDAADAGRCCPTIYVTLHGGREARDGDGGRCRTRAHDDAGAGQDGSRPLAWTGVSDKRSYYRLFAAYVLALFATGIATVALALLAFDLDGRRFRRDPRHGAVDQDAGLCRRRPDRRRPDRTAAAEAASDRAGPGPGGEPAASCPS